MAFFPPLWFAVMDKKVMDWAGGDLSKINTCPKAMARLEKQWNRPKEA